jgi:hypothetical protein
MIGRWRGETSANLPPIHMIVFSKHRAKFVVYFSAIFQFVINFRVISRRNLCLLLLPKTNLFPLIIADM